MMMGRCESEGNEGPNGGEQTKRILIEEMNK